MQENQTELERFRNQYPMYDHVSDEDVAERLYSTYSGQMSRAEFDTRFYGQPEPAPINRAVRAAANAVPSLVRMGQALRLSPEQAEAEQAGRIADREHDLGLASDALERMQGMSRAERVLTVRPNIIAGGTLDNGRVRGGRYDGLTADEIVERMPLDEVEQIDGEVMGVLGRRQAREQTRLDQAKASLPEHHPAADAVARPLQGVGTMAGGAVQGLGWLQSEIENAAQSVGIGDGDVRAPSETELGQLGHKISQGVRDFLPTDAARDNDFLYQVAEAPGQIAAMAVPGALATKALGTAAGTGTAATIGATAGAGENIEDAARFDATGPQQRLAGRVGAAAGSLEALGAGRGFIRGGAPASSALRGRVQQGASEMISEGLQEGTQTLSQNVVAANTYDPSREYGSGVGRAIAVGAVAGGGAGFLAGGQSAPERRNALHSMEDEDLVTSRELLASSMSSAYQEAREVGTSTVDAINALSDHAELLEQFDHEVGRRGLEVSSYPAPISQDPDPELYEQQPVLEPVAPAAAQVLPELPTNIEYVDPRDLQVDAETFQFKAGGDSQGVTDRLQGVTQWDPAKANVVTVWENNAGERFIADGHQRRGLAVRLIEQDPSQAGNIGMLAQILRERDGVTAGQARAHAAVKNIAEGTGSATDAAKVLREAPEFFDASMPRGAMLSQARGLSQLTDEAFGAVVNEVVPENQGAIVGHLVEDPAQQMAVIDVLAKANPSDAFAAEAVVRQVLSAPFQEQKTGSLFGEEVITQSLVAERAKVLSAVNREIRNNRRVFSTLTREADNIEGAGNALDRAANARRVQDNGQLEQVLQKLASRQGPVAAELNIAAQRLADGERLRAVAREFTADLQRRVGEGGLNSLLADGDRGRPDEPGAAEPSRAEQKRELRAQLDAGASAEQLQETDIVATALQEMVEITPTAQVYDLGSSEYLETRRFVTPEGAVTGVDALLDYHTEHAKTFAWTDEGKTAPENPVDYNREITFVTGYPAAGKSTIANPAARHLRSAILDADEIKKTIPEYAGGIGAMATHEESSRLSSRLYRDMLDTGVNIVWPKIGNDPKQIERLALMAREAGYSVNVIWVDTAKSEAMRRMIGRFISRDRIIPPKLLDIDRIAFKASYDYLKDTGIAARSVHVDANAPQDIGAAIVEDNGGLLAGSEIDRRQMAGSGREGRERSTLGSGKGTSQTAPGAAQEGNLFGRVVARSAGLPLPSGELRDRTPVARGAAPVAEKNLSSIIQDLTALLSVSPVRRGRLSVRGALGQMDKKSGVIRLRDSVDFPTLTHEAGHAIAFMHRDVFDRIVERAGPELSNLAGGVEFTDSTQMDEGFAEFVRVYMTAPRFAKNMAPIAYQAFEREMFQVSPKIIEGLQDAQRAYAALLAAPSGENIAGDTVRSSDGRGFKAIKEALAEPAEIGNAVSQFADGLYTATIDKLHPIKRAETALLDIYERNTGERLELSPSESSYKLARLATDARSRGHMDLIHGVTAYDAIDPEGPALADALEHALGRRVLDKWDDKLIAEFDSYLISRRAVIEWDRFEDGQLPNAPDKFSRADHELNLAELNAKYPEFSEAAEMVYGWNNRMLEKKRDAGLLTPQQFEQYTRDHPDYVPFMRDMRQERGGRPGARTRMDNSDNGQRKFKGSNRAIISPIEMMMRDAFLTAEAIARNDMIGALYDLSEQSGLGSGVILEEVPNTEMRAQRLDAKAVIEAAARDAGVDRRDVATVIEAMDERLGGQTFGTIYRSQETTPKGEQVLYLWRNGERKALRLGDDHLGRELFDAFTAVGKEQIGFSTKVASVFASGLRYGITTSPDFLAANWIRDQLSAWILTDNFTPVVSGARQLAEDVASGGDISRRYNTFGGIMGGGNVAATTQASVEQDVNALRKKGYQARRFASWRGFAEFTELSETNTRMALFNEAFKNAKKQGMGDRDAAIQAAFIARDYIDFGRHGSQMLAAKRVLVFLNASLQGLDKSARVLSGGSSLRRILRPLVGKGKPNMTAQERSELALAGKAWAKVALALGGAGLALTALFEDEPWYNELSEYARDTHWWVKIGDEIMGIPKPFELAIPSNIIERAFEMERHQDPNSWGRMRRGVMRLLAPPVENPLFSVPVELYANKDFFRGRQIIPDYMQGLSPAEQWNAYTSAFGREVGSTIGVSPMVIDHIVTGFGGSWGRTALDASSALGDDGSIPPTQQLEDIFVLRRFFKDPFRGSRSSDEFWQHMNATGGHLQQVSSTYQRIARSGQPERAAAYLLDQEPIAREFTVAMQHLPPVLRGVHPMIRAHGAMNVYSSMRREINGQGLRFAGTENLIGLTPDQAAATDLVLRRMLVLEAADALYRTGFPGYQEKPRLDRGDLERELNAVSPTISEELRRRMMAGRVLPHDRMAALWPSLQQRLSQFDGASDIEPWARMERAQSLRGEM